MWRKGGKMVPLTTPHRVYGSGKEVCVSVEGDPVGLAGCFESY
jgi:hypothetical protein